MRLNQVFLALMVAIGCAGAVAQEEKPPTLGKEPDGQQQQGQQQQQRPTLGESPSAGGPRNSTTTDIRKLLRVRTVYIETIDNSLNEKLAEALSKAGPFRVVAKRNEADAILRGTCFDSRRLKSLHSEVFLTDPHGGPIWTDIIREPFNPPPLDKSVMDSASLIVTHLGESLREAQRK
jgi:hypothetical protein